MGKPVCLEMIVRSLRPESEMHRPESAHAETVRVAREIFAENDSETPRLFQLVWPEADKIAFIPAPWENDRMRLAMLEGVRKIIHETAPSFYSVISEVWTVTREADTTDKRQPSQCEDKQERLFVLTVAPYLEPIATSIPILPGRELGQAEDRAPGTFRGDLTELFT